MHSSYPLWRTKENDGKCCGLRGLRLLNSLKPQSFDVNSTETMRKVQSSAAGGLRGSSLVSSGHVLEGHSAVNARLTLAALCRLTAPACPWHGLCLASLQVAKLLHPWVPALLEQLAAGPWVLGWNAGSMGGHRWCCQGGTWVRILTVGNSSLCLFTS